ncbi:MAG TPA: lytic murein transglycosylase [Solirubrobacteraceae bacterium]|nr:lytic murein transglycosylase [Solirubrobacteraceae bacterium]
MPGFYIESFRIPPFLLPIFQAAGSAYGIPWQVLAAINEVETDYGRDLSVSSAGAEGWMQFLPSSWETYGVDANGDGFKDPYNPADAIFAAARYLKAAGGDVDIRGAVYSYNHSQAYVASVLLRAQLLGGTPPNLLGAITGLTQARFPVHAQSHFSDGFQTVVGTTIYSQQGAPVIAVQDGQILGFGHTPSLGRYVSMRDAYGNTYTYAELGSVAKLYPVLVPHAHAGASAQAQQAGPSGEPAPLAPASAGTQSRAPLSEGAAGTGLQLGVGSGLEVPAAGAAPASGAPPAVAGGVPILHAPAPRVLHLASEDVYLHPLSAGVQVLAGTVLGHVGPGTSVQGSLSAPGPHMLFQIRPAGAGAPLIDPKPVLDGWVALENTSIFRAKGANPFPSSTPAAGQVLLESKAQLEQQVLGDAGIHLSACGRHDVQTGQVGRRVLAMLEFLSVSALRPAVSSLQCSRGTGATAANAAESTAGDTVEITAVNGMAIATHQGRGSIAEATIRKLLGLQGMVKPSQIAGPVSYPGAPSTLAARRRGDSIHVAFAPLGLESRPPGGGSSPRKARSAGIFSAAITPGQWVQLIARLGEIPNPKVGSGPSAAAIPDHPGAPRAAVPSPGGEGK